MSEILEQHKRFLVGAIGGALAFLIGWAIIGALFNDDIALHQRSIKRDLAKAKNAVPSGVNVSALKRSATELEEQVLALGKLIARDPGSFTLEGNASEPDLYYNRKVQELLGPTRLQRLALIDVTFDENLGRPEKYPNSRTAFEWNLRGLDVVDQIMQHVLGANEELGGGLCQVNKVEILPRPKRRRSGGARRDLLTFHEVRFEVVGHPIGVSHLIEKLARRPEPGRGLVLIEARVESLDAPEGSRGRPEAGRSVADLGLVTGNFLVAAVDIDWEGAPEARKVK